MPTKSEAFDVLVTAFEELTPPERANLLYHAKTWPAGRIACGSRATDYYSSGFA